MASNRIDVTVNGKDNTAAAFNSTSKGINKLEQDALKAGSTVGSSFSRGVATANKAVATLGSTGASAFAKISSAAATAGSTVGSAISRGASVASSALSRVGSSASYAFGQIKAGASGANQSLGGLGGAISGVLGGFGLLQAGSAIVGGAMTKQFTQAELAMKVGDARAKELANSISQIVAATPGDDTYMNQLLGGMVAKEQSLSNDQLRTAGFLASDYIIKSRSVGKTMLETQMDLKEYLLTGNTGQMERDSILKMQLDTLKGQGTVGDRILALDKAMKAEGYEGLSQMDIMQIKWDTLKGKIQLAATTIGEKILPPLEKIVGWILKLDEKTGGWSSILMVAVGTIGLLFIALGPVVAATISAWYAMKSYRLEAEKAAIAAALIKPPTGTPVPPTGPVQRIIDIGWQWAPTLTTGAMLAGTTATLKSVGMLMATNIAKGFAGVFGAILGPIIYATFEQQGGPIQNWLNGLPIIDWTPFNQFKKDLAGIPAYFGKTLADLTTLWNAFTGGIVSAWSAVDGFMKWSITSLAGAMTATFNQAAAGVIGAWNWIKGAAGNSIAWILGAWNNLKSAVGRGVTGAVNILSGSIQWAIDKFWELYNTVRNNPIVQKIITVASSGLSAATNFVNNPVGTVKSAAQGAWNWLTGAKGPGDVKYQSYAGFTGKNPWQTDGTLAGNCVDMSMGLVSRFGGELVNGTWNGGMHTWWRAPDGKEYDPSRKALNNTWAPPTSRGPGDGNGTTYVFNAPVYGYDDFQKKVEQANSNLITGTF